MHLTQVSDSSSVFDGILVASSRQLSICYKISILSRNSKTMHVYNCFNSIFKFPENAFQLMKGATLKVGTAMSAY